MILKLRATFFLVSFKKEILFSLLLFFASVIRLNAQCNVLVWSDEFNGSALDMNNWSYEVGNGCGTSAGCNWGNNELQYYTNGTNNVNVTGGNLVITPKYEPNYNGSGLNYSSGRIISQGKQSWLHGHMEARIKIPSAQGVWPAFWMLAENNNWPYTGEIDILEAKNKNASIAYQTIHYWCSPCGSHQYTGTSPNLGVDLSAGYHIYAVDWSQGKIQYSIDGTVTATYTAASLVGGNASDWTFDAQNFFLLFNVAVGGNFTGTTPVSSDYPVSMLVDYVRVYSTPSTFQITGEDLVFVGDTKTYSVNSGGAGTTYNWTVPAGASIISGQGTNQISVQWVSGTGGSLSVSVDPDGAGACAASGVSVAVKVIAKTCALIMDDFESNRNLSGQLGNGALTVVANPGTGGSNSSSTVGRYARNSGVSYDILSYDDFLVGDPDDFRNGIRQFTMDVRSNAPAGTSITIEFVNSVLTPNPYPAGRHSQYTATTGASNVWTKLTFSFAGSPDAALTGSDVDRIQILFHPNSNAGEIFYFDNFTAQGKTPVTSAIAGSASVCQNLAAVSYSVSGLSGSTYNWNVPSGASIASGQGTNSISVNFGNTSGNVTVTETSSANCVGAMQSLFINVTGSCVLAVDFSASILSTCTDNVITFTDLTTGKSSGDIYSWNFGAGATPSVSSSSDPVNVSYTSGGTKTVSLTVTNANGSNTKTKNNFITIATPPSGCIFSDEFNNNSVSWIAPNPGAFTHAESGDSWNISNTGYPEWENFTYALNNGSTATPLNFQCGANKPIVKIKAKASANALLRVTMMDNNGQAVDNIPGINLELTNVYQTFSIDFSTHFRNYNGPSPGFLDSTTISYLQFYVNPGYVSFPYAGANATYNTTFPGTINIDWIGIGNNCSQTSLPVELIDFSAESFGAYSQITWATAQEKDNAYFTIEKSRDGIRFYSIERVAGQGNSLATNYYFFDDYSDGSGLVYYRLKQVDFNEGFQYSRVISLSGIPGEDEVKIVPLPSIGNQFVITWNKDIKEETRVDIYNLLGEIVFSQILNVGKNSLEGAELPVLPSGIYLVQVSGFRNKKKLIVN